MTMAELVLVSFFGVSLSGGVQSSETIAGYKALSEHFTRWIEQKRWITAS